MNNMKSAIDKITQPEPPQCACPVLRCLKRFTNVKYPPPLSIPVELGHIAMHKSLYTLKLESQCILSLQFS